MLKSKMWFAVGLFFVFMAHSLPAQDIDKEFKRIAEMDPGVQNIKPKSGPIESFLVIGKGEVKRSLPKAMALKEAVKEAERTARTAAAKFFNTSVKWEQTDSGLVVCSTIGGSAGDDGEAASKTTASATEASSEFTRQCAEAALAGLTLVWAGYDSDGFRVQIWGWKASGMSAVRQAANMMGAAAREAVNEAKAAEGARMQDPNKAFRNAEYQKGNNGGAGNSPVGNGNNAEPNKKSVHSDDAADFL